MGAFTVMAAAAVVGGALAANEGNKARGAAGTAARDRTALYDQLRQEMPGISDLELDLLVPQLVGEYDPESIQKETLGPSAMENVSADPNLKIEQLKALAGISEVAEGGLSEADMAASRGIQREVNQNNQARQEKILMDMAQRGVLGSGGELAARLNSNQMASDQQSAASDNLIQQAQARSLQALSQQGNMAGNMRTQDVGEQSNVAQARDAISQFNTQNSQNVGAQNVGNRNIAQQQNLANKQAISNAGVDIKNTQQQYNKNLQVDNYNRLKDIADAKQGIVKDRGAAEAEAFKNSAAAISGAASGVGKGIMGGFGG